MEKFKGQYRIDLNGKKSPQTRYSTAEKLTERVKDMTERHQNAVLQVLVYSFPSDSEPTDNKGQYIVSGFCTSVAAEIKRSVSLNGNGHA